MAKTTLKLVGEKSFFLQEAYKVLRSNLQFCGADVRVVSITSCHENEGKTEISLGLGRSLAELKKRVLVIDADMRKSVIAGRNADVLKPEGLSEVLSRQRELDACIYQTQYEGLDILFAGKYPPNPVELLSAKSFETVLEDCRKRYDYVIIDTPPLGRVIDAAVVAPLCDGTIMLVSDGKVRIATAQEVLAQLKMSGGKILGIVRSHAGKLRRIYKSKRYAYRYTK